MRKIRVMVIQGHKTFSAFPFSAYIGKMDRGGYYIQLARSSTSLNRDVSRTTFKTKAAAEKVIRRWLRAKTSEYDAKEQLKKLRYKKRK